MLPVGDTLVLKLVQIISAIGQKATNCSTTGTKEIYGDKNNLPIPWPKRTLVKVNTHNDRQHFTFLISQLDAKDSDDVFSKPPRHHVVRPGCRTCYDSKPQVDSVLYQIYINLWYFLKHHTLGPYPTGFLWLLMGLTLALAIQQFKELADLPFLHGRRWGGLADATQRCKSNKSPEMEADDILLALKTLTFCDSKSLFPIVFSDWG